MEACAYNSARRKIQPYRDAHAGGLRCVLPLSVAEVLEHEIDRQLVLLAPGELHRGLEIVAALARDAHRVALDGALDLELAVLDGLDQRLRLLRLDPLREGEHLRDELAAVLDRAVREP